jgi:DNA-binding CsgD family transcriptional regulator
VSCSDNSANRFPALEDLTSAPDYSLRANEVIARITAAQREADACALLKEATALIGGEVSAFVSFARDDESHETYRFLLACNPEYCDEYERHGWFANDPRLLYASKFTEPIQGSLIPWRGRAQEEMLELARKYGFVSTAVVPAPSNGRVARVGVLCVGAPIDGYFEGPGFVQFRLSARLLAMELHEWWIKRARAELIARARITSLEVELLEFEWQGHGTKRIAQMLGRSEASVNNLFQRLNAKLGVPTRHAAARVAAEFGLI